MKELMVFIILTLIIFCYSFSDGNPKHLIIGKWESKITPKLTLYFDEEKYLKGEITGSNGYVYKYNRQYFVVNENNVFMIDKSVGQKVTIEVKVENDKMSLDCDYERPPNQPNIVDLPQLCNYQEFSKIN